MMGEGSITDNAFISVDSNLFMISRCFYLNHIINPNNWCLKYPNSDRSGVSTIMFILNSVTFVIYINIFTQNKYILFFLTFSIYGINSTLYICSLVLLYHLLATSYFTPMGIIVSLFYELFLCWCDTTV